MPVHFLSGWLLLTGAFLTLTTATTAFTTSHKPTKFKAAVYAHVMPSSNLSIVSRAVAVAGMKKILDVFLEQAKLAREQGAVIIVFPEDGISPFTNGRDGYYSSLEEIPDPRLVNWSPCQDPTQFNDTDVQYMLSCMARQQSMYVVANMGEKKPCNVTLDSECPPDGRYQYNTAVAFGPDGHLLARYRKVNLFHSEVEFDIPKPEVIYFETPFGRFGLLICYDIFVFDPAITMVIEHQVTNLVFPTSWTDALPLLSAIGFHSSFARALGINFLAANLQKPIIKNYGSGIYGPDGMKTFYYNNTMFSPPKLLVTELDVLDKPRLQLNVLRNSSKGTQQPLIPDSQESSNSSSDVFYAFLFDDEFKFLEVDGLSGNKSICSKSNKVCCYLDYTKADAAIAKEDGEEDLFAFGVFDGLHTLEVQVYFQTCALVRCADSRNRSSCGTETTKSSTAFKKIEIRGTFQTPYVYPQVVLHEPPADLKLAEPHAWSYDGMTLLTNSEMQSPVLSAALCGIDYRWDDFRYIMDLLPIAPGDI